MADWPPTIFPINCTAKKLVATNFPSISPRKGASSTAPFPHGLPTLDALCSPDMAQQLDDLERSMMKAVLIDPTTRHVDPFDLDEHGGLSGLRYVLGTSRVEIGARLPDGATIYLASGSLSSSEHFFRHAMVPTPLPGLGVLVGGQSLSTVRAAVTFMCRAEVFPISTAPGADEQPFADWLMYLKNMQFYYQFRACECW